MKSQNNRILKLNLGGIGKKIHDDIGEHLTVNIIQPCDIQHDLNKFPYPFDDNSIDDITSIHTLEHLDNPLKVMCEIYRICKPNAEIFIQLPNHSQDEKVDPWHKLSLKPRWFVKLCSGFRSNMREQSEYWKPFNFKIIKMWHTRGTIRFWKNYNLNVILKVIK